MPTEEESYLPYSEPYAVPIHRILCECWNNELSADEALEEIMDAIERAREPEAITSATLPLLALVRELLSMLQDGQLAPGFCNEDWLAWLAKARRAVLPASPQ